MNYKQLTSQQGSQIFALLQRKTPRKDIVRIVGCSESTLCRELKRNSTAKGNYLWDKAHAKAMERRKRSTSNKKLDSGRKAAPLARTVIRLLYGYRKYLKTITTDNGSEFASHLDITAGLRIRGMDDVSVYFADSYCSWQKGAVVHENKLIRQYIPKNPISMTFPIITSAMSDEN